MKKTTQIVFLLFSLIGFAQEEEFHKMVEAEMKTASKKMELRINPNTTNYDVTYSKLEFTVNPSVYNIVGKVTTTFKALSNMTTVTFELTNQLTVSSVKKGVTNLTFTQNDSNELIITLPSTVTTGNSETVEINYSGAPATDNQAFSTGTHGSSIPVLTTLSEPYGALDWWPCKQDLNDKIDSIDIYITAPSTYLSSSNGVELSRTINGANATTHFKHNYPIPAYLVAIAVSNYTKKNTGTAGTVTTFPIVDYIYPENDNAANIANLAQTAPIINFYETKVGAYPFNTEKYGHTQWNWGGGMEHSTNSFMVNFSRGLLSHELAHQWFGDKITCGSWKDIWLNEGITEYLSGLVVENFDGAASFVTWKGNKTTSITSQPTGNLYLYDSQLTDVNRIFSSRITYNKGSMVTNMLRYVMGDTNFFQALRNYQADPLLAYKYAVTPQFQAHLEAVHGSSLQEFFNDWVYKEGYPIYAINAYKSGATQAIVTINQTQSITNSAQTGYVSYFEMPVPVRLTFSNGATQDLRLNNTFNGQNFLVTIPAGVTITAVTFDPNKDIISRNSTTTLSSDDFTFSNHVNLFPNPSREYVEIELPSYATLQKVNFYTVLGQKAFESNSNKINISGLSNGIYSIIIETSEGKALKKFIKN
ncbi:T9SS type A sorting domain-containing protein [Flavobacterium amniphilum]|uniref:M1 family aminopeptidase n=1 Tax=Flavobacterium amniphilum TaxID=1834035 RepID=UPI002029EF07|nr:M1 family aminopeptidase [Flavobacterium amniphilum]MCL9803982.1 T9SS type A sorting domain-containing protein [Flavobacterium amniphilum]